MKYTTTLSFNEKTQKHELTKTINAEELVQEITQNLPEYALSFECTDWNYEACAFTLKDTEDKKVYAVNMKSLLKGLAKMVNDIQDKKLFIFNEDPDCILDAGMWDAEAVDALLQYAAFGELRGR